MKKIILICLVFSLVLLLGCTKTVYLKNDQCPSKCVTAFYEDKGTCRENLDQLNRQGIIIGFDPIKFQCDGSYESNGICQCHCNCGLGYSFELS